MGNQDLGGGVDSAIHSLFVFVQALICEHRAPGETLCEDDVSVRTNKRASSSGGALADRSSVLCRSRPAAFACLHRLPACSRPRLPARPRCTDARPAHAQQACRRARYGGGAGGCAVLLGLPSYTNKEHVLGARCTRVQVSCISRIPHLQNLWEKGKIVVLCCCYVVGGAQGIFWVGCSKTAEIIPSIPLTTQIVRCTKKMPAAVSVGRKFDSKRR